MSGLSKFKRRLLEMCIFTCLGEWFAQRDEGHDSIFAYD